MSNHQLNAQARWENAHSLAAVLGIDSEHAEELLSANVLVTVDQSEPLNVALAAEVSMLLVRTLQSAGSDVDPMDAGVEIVIGQVAPRSSAPTIWVSSDGNAACISREPPKVPGIQRVHPVVLIVVACYAAAAALRVVIGDRLPLPTLDPLVLDLQALGVTPAIVERHVDLGQAYLAGAGAIGNGFLWALRWFDVGGELDIVDFDKVKAGNLNRQLWFGETEVGLYKAERLAAIAQPSFPRLNLVPRVGRLQDLPEKKTNPHWLRRLVVGVDSRLARRSLQSEIPGEVFDASTTDIREVVFHFNRQPTAQACLGCIYPPDDLETGRIRDIAQALGVTFEDVEEGIITPSAARVILARYPDQGLTSATLEGEAYDSLFKALCAKAALRVEGDRQVFAPFAFVSALAGAVLAIETIRRIGGEPTRFNLWKVSPWFPFIPKLQREIPASASCPICGELMFRAVAKQLWGS